MNLQTLFIEDEEKIRTNLVKIFNGETIGGHIIIADSAENFEMGMDKISKRDYDIIILDLCKGAPSETSEKPGYDVLKKIQSLAFIPVIFYSGLTRDIESLSSEVIGVVNKGEGVEKLRSEIERIITSKIAILKSLIYSHLRESLRQYFWETVHAEKKYFEPIKNDISIGYLLLRRFANSLSKENIKKILGDDNIKIDKAHPMEFYIFPTEQGEYEAGEILFKDGTYFAILTPSCDFIEEGTRKRKVGKILLAKALQLKDSDLYKKYESNKEKYKQSLAELIESRKGDRYFFFPKTPFIDNLFLDFQNKVIVNYEELITFTRIAKLDDPFAQSMVTSFIRYYNRIGFPDIDSDYVIQKM